jgi:hypothetical protein
MGFEVFAVVKSHVMVFWVIALCSCNDFFHLPDYSVPYARDIVSRVLVSGRGDDRTL